MLPHVAPPLPVPPPCFSGYQSLVSSPLLNTARLLLALSMLLTFPADLMVLRGTAENVLESARKYGRWRRLRSPVHDVRLLSALKAQDDEYRAASADKWTLAQGCTRGLGEHVALTLGLFAGALGVALAVTDLGAVLEVSGAISAVFLAFVIPAAIRLRLGPTPDDVLPVFHRANWPAWFTLSFGVLAFVTSAGFTLLELVSGVQVSLAAGEAGGGTHAGGGQPAGVGGALGLGVGPAG